MEIACDKCGQSVSDTSKFCGSCGARLMQLTENPLLLRLETCLRTIAPNFWSNRVRPGANPVVIINFEKKLGIKFPPLVREFFLWRSFPDSSVHWNFGWPSAWVEWGYSFFSFEDIVAHHDFLCEMYGAELEKPHGFDPGGEEDEELEPGFWNVHWIPMFGREADCMCLDMAGLFDGKVGQLVEYDNRSQERHITFSSFGEYLEVLVESIEEGLWKEETDLDAEPLDWAKLHGLFQSKSKSPMGTFLVGPEEVKAPEPRPITSGHLSQLRFVPSPTYNGTNPPVSETSCLSGKLYFHQTGGSTLFLDVKEIEGNRTRCLHLKISDGNDVRAGRAYQVGGLHDGNACFVSLYEVSTIGEIRREDRRWQPSVNTTGSITITKFSDREIEFDFSFDNVEPDPVPTSGNACGTLSLSGQVFLVL